MESGWHLGDRCAGRDRCFPPYKRENMGGRLDKFILSVYEAKELVTTLNALNNSENYDTIALDKIHKRLVEFIVESN